MNREQQLNRILGDISMVGLCLGNGDIGASFYYLGKATANTQQMLHTEKQNNSAVALAKSISGEGTTSKAVVRVVRGGKKNNGKPH